MQATQDPVNTMVPGILGIISNMLCGGVDFNLEVEEAFSKLHSLSGVRNCVIKATLCKTNHLKHTQGQS